MKFPALFPELNLTFSSISPARGVPAWSSRHSSASNSPLSSRRLSSKLVFPNGAGNPIAWPSWLHRSWQPLLKKAEVSKVVFHSLRHNYVSVLQAAKYDWPIIQSFAGHRDLSTTQDIYTHALPGQEAGAGQKIEGAFEAYVH